MNFRRVAWLAGVLAGCTCNGPGELDAGLPEFDAGMSRDAGQDAGSGRDAGVDSGAVDSGVDAGSVDSGADAGSVDSGVDAGRDAGTVDGGDDAGPLPGCGTIVCPPWQRCVESSSGARCAGTVTLSWVSPIPGASAPMDLQSIPLAIDTNADSTLEVPWTSGGVLSSVGAFSGQMGIRAATLLLADADAGVVVLTAGWHGGPSASTQLTLTRPFVRPPAVPSYGTNGPDFEPNDPAGNAFRRDDVVRVEVDDLPQPMALFARLDAPNARTSAFPVTERCDGGSCWLVALWLGDLDFPAFRGRVLVWASGADGGMQTRPRAIPVTRWRWRRQVSGVPNPLSVTRPVASDIPGAAGILVGSADTASTGRLLALSAGGQALSFSDSVLAQNTRAVHTLAVSQNAVAVGLAGPSGASLRISGSSEIALDGGHPVASGATGDTLAPPLFVVATGTGVATVADSTFNSTFRGCESPTRSTSRLMVSSSVLTFSPNSPLCVASLQPPHDVHLTSQAYNVAFGPTVFSPSSVSFSVYAAGADGGIWWVSGSAGSMVPPGERLVWDGGLVDTIAVTNGTTGMHVYWADSDRVVRWAPTNPTSLVPFAATGRLPSRVESTPVIVAVFNRPDRNSIAFVDPLGGVAVLRIPGLEPFWSLPSSSVGVQGAVAAEPVFIDSCDRLGSLLIASRGNGSLYSLVGDLPSITPYDSWPMGGRSQGNSHSASRLYCVPE
ncbi:MAG: hypothetical protein Q8L14_35895 [Myxococcales bacterium]|nr:hypothetical protein [Myxococcales bacterium]